MYNDVHKSTSPEPMFQIDVTKSAPQIGEHRKAVTFSSLEEAEVRSRAPRKNTSVVNSLNEFLFDHLFIPCTRPISEDLS